MTRLLLGLMIVTLAGCATRSLPPSTAMLDEADRLVVLGDYAAAAMLYDELLTRYPDDETASRARAGRESAAAVLAARAELAGLREQLAARGAEVRRLREQLAAQEQAQTVRHAETARLQQDLAARQAEIARLTAEADKLRADLENLKRIDLKLERRR